MRVCKFNKCIESTTYSTLIIGVYLPTADAPIDVFRSCLHTLEDLTNNHRGPVILAGDYVGTEGGPRGSRNSNLQGELLLETVQNNDLFITSLSNMSSGPLYTYFSGEICTTTDYIIMNARHACLATTCKTHDHHPLNFSDHLPLSLTMSITPIASRNTQCSLRLNWQEAATDGSVQVYATRVNEIICPYLGKSYDSISSLEEDICHVSTSILHAASCIITVSFVMLYYVIERFNAKALVIQKSKKGSCILPPVLGIHMHTQERKNDNIV